MSCGGNCGCGGMGDLDTAQITKAVADSALSMAQSYLNTKFHASGSDPANIPTVEDLMIEAEKIYNFTWSKVEQNTAKE